MSGPDARNSAADTAARRVAPAGLCWFADDGEYIVYNDVSGRTHHLDPAASLIFASLTERPMAPAEIGALLADRWRMTPEELDREAVQRIFNALEDAGLIGKAPA